MRVKENEANEVAVLDELMFKPVTMEDVIADRRGVVYVEAADAVMEVIGYTEHGLRHAKRVGKVARQILRELGFNDRLPELAALAGFFHDVGNVINRTDHAHSSALMAMQILTDLGISPKELAIVLSAIGHHDELDGGPVSVVSAAVILADKTDLHRSRVRVMDPTQWDIHDRVNYAATRSALNVDSTQKVITLEIDVDTSIASVMEFFEIFTQRLIMCRTATEFLGCQFRLVANNVELYGSVKR
ncbi:MAG: HD domain-containing protein [Acidobacteriota bacterium]|nr:HD domain-containing protein [Blastocatellia bacterium]MDW8240114.1 HD domain-containing protein [Acidobacteriota bacterium]